MDKNHTIHNVYNTILIVIYTISYRDFEFRVAITLQRTIHDFLLHILISSWNLNNRSHHTHQTPSPGDKIKVNYFT